MCLGGDAPGLWPASTLFVTDSRTDRELDGVEVNQLDQLVPALGVTCTELELEVERYVSTLVDKSLLTVSTSRE